MQIFNDSNVKINYTLAVDSMVNQLMLLFVAEPTNVAWQISLYIFVVLVILMR